MEKGKPEVDYRIFEISRHADILSPTKNTLIDSHLSDIENFESFDRAMEKIENDGEPLTLYTILPIIRCPLK